MLRNSLFAVAVLVCAAGQEASAQMITISPSTPIPVGGGATWSFPANGSFSVGGPNKFVTKIYIELRESVTNADGTTSWISVGTKTLNPPVNSPYNVSFSYNKVAGKSYKMYCELWIKTGQNGTPGLADTDEQNVP